MKNSSQLKKVLMYVMLLLAIAGAAFIVLSSTVISRWEIYTEQ